jgi:protocatechuate 3,4-dioxygenase beta subunit
LLTFLPSIAAAQSTIAGVVKDTSGAVLPGATVEAASPVLIEKTRSVVTDSDGRYSIVSLRPGTYEVTFTLPGFSTFKRDGIIVPADTTVPVNAEMRVGADRGDGDGIRRVAGRRRPEHVASADHDARPHGRDPQRAQHPVDRVARPRRPAQRP